MFKEGEEGTGIPSPNVCGVIIGTEGELADRNALHNLIIGSKLVMSEEDQQLASDAIPDNRPRGASDPAELCRDS